MAADTACPPGRTVSVLPSGAARATVAADVVPPAPGRDSTTIGCPRRLLRLSATSRATRSKLAPGVNPCIKVMVRPPWANAGAIARADAPLRTERRVSFVIVVVVSGCKCLLSLPLKWNQHERQRWSAPSPLPNPGLPGLVTLYLPEAGKPAAGRGRAGEGGRSYRASRLRYMPTPTPQ